MAEGPQAMDDLKSILESRAALYAKADVEVNTSDKAEAEALSALLAAIGERHPATAAALSGICRLRSERPRADDAGMV